MGAGGGSTAGVMTKRGYAANRAVFLEPSFRAALAARPEADLTWVLDTVFADAAARIAADPAAVNPDYRLATGRIRRDFW